MNSSAAADSYPHAVALTTPTHESHPGGQSILAGPRTRPFIAPDANKSATGNPNLRAGKRGA